MRKPACTKKLGSICTSGALCFTATIWVGQTTDILAKCNY